MSTCWEPAHSPHWLRPALPGRLRDPRRYKGYKDKQAEELRKGIGPENISAAAWVQPKELPIPLLPQELGEIQG